MGEGGQNGDPQEHRAQNGTHQEERRPRISGLRLPEDAHAIGDGFGAGHGRTPIGEGPQEVEGGDAENQTAAGGMAQVHRRHDSAGHGAAFPSIFCTNPATISTTMLAMKK